MQSDKEIMEKSYEALREEWLTHLERDSLDFNPETDMCRDCEKIYKKHVLKAIRLARAEGFKEGEQKTRQEDLKKLVQFWKDRNFTHEADEVIPEFCLEMGWTPEQFNYEREGERFPVEPSGGVGETGVPATELNKKSLAGTAEVTKGKEVEVAGSNPAAANSSERIKWRGKWYRCYEMMGGGRVCVEEKKPLGDTFKTRKDGTKKVSFTARQPRRRKFSFLAKTKGGKTARVSFYASKRPKKRGDTKSLKERKERAKK